MVFLERIAGPAGALSHLLPAPSTRAAFFVKDFGFVKG
jgi:hypothetical protein